VCGGPREIHIAFRDLAQRERRALLHHFDVYRQTFEGVTPPEGEGGGDVLVTLYRCGAREDLSNLDVQFRSRGSNTLALFLRLAQAGGELRMAWPAGLGMVYLKEAKESR
jgi:hypothetical protein